MTEQRREGDDSLSTRTLAYRYDYLGRLTRELSASTQLTDANYTWHYGYDLVGNRIFKSPTMSASDGMVYSYDAIDRITFAGSMTGGKSSAVTYQYDAGGSASFKLTRRLETITDESATPHTQRTDLSDYDYDLRNRLVGLGRTVVDSELEPESSPESWIAQHTTHTVAAYAYDPTGIRVSASSTVKDIDHTTSATLTTTDARQNLIDANNPTGYAQILEERAVINAGAPAYTHYLIGDDVIAQATGGTVKTLIYDGLGSTRLLMTGSTIMDRYLYDAFGNAIGFDTATAGTKLLFTGEQFDQSLQQYYLRARYYDPGIGRFISFDSEEGLVGRPISLHKYSYANVNPVCYLDPSGQFAIVSNFLYGRAVHMKIGAHFSAGGPGRLYDRTINTILKTWSLTWGLLRPDLTDTMTGAVYEIKPINSAIAGVGQLGTYVVTLNQKDPAGRAWVFGRTYTPPPVIQINPLVYAVVSPPKLGIIVYQLFDFGMLIGAIGAYATARLYGHINIAILNSSLLGVPL